MNALVKAKIDDLRSGCIVSCQALPNEPLYGSNHMAAMALAAEQGGAVAIRANTPVDIQAIKRCSRLPVIGLYKREYEGFDVYITPTMKEVREVIEAGSDFVAIDATRQPRPDGNSLADLVMSIRAEFPHTPIVADVSTYDEGEAAMDLGVDLVSTTLSGYTLYSMRSEHVDIDLVARLARLGRVPILAEGRIWDPSECVACLQAGAHAVVIGTAVTRPQEITKRFVHAIRQFQEEQS